MELDTRGISASFRGAPRLQSWLTYLRLAEKPVGLLINFNEQVLKDGIKRVINPDCLDKKYQP